MFRPGDKVKIKKDWLKRWATTLATPYGYFVGKTFTISAINSIENTAFLREDCITGSGWSLSYLDLVERRRLNLPEWF